MNKNVEELFSEVCDLPPEDRVTAITQACDGDEDLRFELESLLAAHDGAGEFMAQPTEDHVPSRDSMSEAEIKTMVEQAIGEETHPLAVR